MLKIPNLEQMAQRAREYFWSKNAEEYRKLRPGKIVPYNRFFEITMFPQNWGSTCLGFDTDANGEPLMGGQMMTDAYTTVFYEPYTETYIVFFGNEPCYEVRNATEVFLKDLKNHQLRPLSQARRVY